MNNRLVADCYVFSILRNTILTILLHNCEVHILHHYSHNVNNNPFLLLFYFYYFYFILYLYFFFVKWWFFDKAIFVFCLLSITQWVTLNTSLNEHLNDAQIAYFYIFFFVTNFWHCTSSRRQCALVHLSLQTHKFLFFFLN